jgi:hypothetical protein
MEWWLTFWFIYSISGIICDFSASISYKLSPLLFLLMTGLPGWAIISPYFMRASESLGNDELAFYYSYSSIIYLTLTTNPYWLTFCPHFSVKSFIPV